MAKLWAVLSGGAAGLVAYRLFRRRRSVPPEPPAEPDARAEELRAKLAEAREAPDPEPAPAEEEPQDVAARREDVHERARAAIDEMRGDTSP